MPAGADPPFQTLLIANRGEIAVRVIRACAELGIRSVAVYSEADQGALHTRLADEAHLIGPGPAVESYLQIPKILEVARISGAQAIHPGYGFLSENPAFAEACEQAGIAFVGPSASAMRMLGDKAAARRLAVANNVPVVPGYDGPDQQDQTLTAEADRIGYPLLVKATAGGGGRGMRVVEAPDALTEALAAARREALAAFGDDTLILERLVAGAHHVEVQILGDLHGALIHLGERDCSVQRRHQKVIEESPGPTVTPELRKRLGEAALRVARAAGYASAGTCEMLLDQSGQFYFLEVNARLQVEHPVTELVTGFDLVRAQIEIAAGRPLPWRQEDVRLRGHAIECRLYAEDPARGDLPVPGRLVRFQAPLGPGLRHDLGYADGDSVPPFYDTMLGKLIAYGEDRATAIARARAALEGYQVEGVTTNRDLLAWILNRPTFQAGAATIDFLAQERPSARPEPAPPPEAVAAAVAWDLAAPVEAVSDPWLALQDWRIAGQGVTLFYEAGAGEARQMLAVVADREDRHTWRIALGEMRFETRLAGDRVSVRSELAHGEQQSALVTRAEGALRVTLADTTYQVRRAAPPDVDAVTTRASEGGVAALEAPMPGRVVRVLISDGDEVREHQPLVVVEAMKIEHTVAAPRDGRVQNVRCVVGEAVSGGQVLVELAPHHEHPTGR